jgi:hypothetical protein
MTEQEQKESQSINQVSDKAIGMIPGYGAFHGIARAGSGLLDSKIKKTYCLSKDGKKLTIYNKKSGQLISEMLKPSHEYASEYIAQKKYGRAAASYLGFDWLVRRIDEKKQPKQECVIVDESKINLQPMPPEIKPITTNQVVGYTAAGGLLLGLLLLFTSVKR